MPTIHITHKTANFSQIDNNLFASTLPEVAHKVLCYLLSRPKDWRLLRSDLKKTLGLTGYKVQKALKILQNLGYAFYRRFTDGRTRWDIFDTPQPTTLKTAPVPPCSPVNTPYSNVRDNENSDDLIILDSVTNTKTTTLTESVIIKNQPVTVVELNEAVELLVYPKQLKESQKRAAKAVIKKAPAPVRQELLFALAYAITAGRVNNPVGYLTALVNRANDGTFEAVTTPKSLPTIEERLKKQAAEQKLRESAQIDNLAHFRQLFKQFGDAVLQAIPEQIPGGVSRVG